jgi:hypothetical protein
MANTDIVNTDIANTDIANSNPALAALADIIEPEFTAHFALAPIYWLLLIISLAVIVYASWQLIQHRRYWLAKRQAIKQIANMRQQPDAANQINQLLKRVLKHYQPAHPALSASSEQWQYWLAKDMSLPLPNLSQLLYKATCSESEVEQFYIFAKQWLIQYHAKADTDVTTASEQPSTAQSGEQYHA